MMIPFHISLILGNSGLEFKGYFKVTWMRIRLFKRDIPSKEEEEEKKEEKKKEKSKWTIERVQKVFNLFLEALPHFQKVLYAVINSFTLEKLIIHLKMGMDSPVDTAQVAGIFWSISSWVNLYPNVSLYIQPEFMKTTLEGDIELELKLKLLWIVIESLKAITKRPVRNFINEIRA
jgi:hypothetical protein